MAANAKLVPTGVPGLDRILRGGLPQSALHLIVGGPGVGKTVLAHQIASSLARRDGAGILYLTTITEGHQSLIDQARSFTFFDPSLMARQWYYASVYPALREGGVEGVSRLISRLVAEREPRLVVVDGLHALRSVAPTPLAYHSLLSELETQGRGLSTTTLLLANQSSTESRDAGLAIPDGIIHLRFSRFGFRRVRALTVRKLRGVAFLSGAHVYRITDAGLHVFPRLAAVVAEEGLPAPLASRGRISTGIAGLDRMTGGGVEAGSVTLVVGGPGSGKTLTGLSFLTAGAQAGETGFYVGFHESPEQLVAKAEGVGLPAREVIRQERLHLRWRPSAELLVDELADRLLAEVDSKGVRRVVLESFDDLRRGALLPERVPDALVALLESLRARGVTTLISNGVPQRAPGGPSTPGLDDPSSAVDNIILLHYADDGGALKRQLCILKIRSHEHTFAPAELRITGGGLQVDGSEAEEQV